MTDPYEEFMTQLKAWEKGQGPKPSVYQAAELLRNISKQEYLRGYYDGLER